MVDSDTYLDGYHYDGKSAYPIHNWKYVDPKEVKLQIKGGVNFNYIYLQRVWTSNCNSFYNITPYFTLKGKNDAQQDIYVTRWDGLMFEHNFETDESGADINFYKDPNNKENTIDPCSYNLEVPFKYSHYKITAGNPNKL
jgi:hypothetical protein